MVMRDGFGLEYALRLGSATAALRRGSRAGWGGSPKSKVQSPKSKVQSRGTRDGVGPEGAEVGNLVLSFEFFLGAMVCKRRVLLIRRRVWLAKAPSSLRFAGAVQDAVGRAMAMGKGREWSGWRRRRQNGKRPTTNCQ